MSKIEYLKKNWDVIIHRPINDTFDSLVDTLQDKVVDEFGEQATREELRQARVIY